MVSSGSSGFELSVPASKISSAAVSYIRNARETGCAAFHLVHCMVRTTDAEGTPCYSWVWVGSKHRLAPRSCASSKVAATSLAEYSDTSGVPAITND